MWVGLAPGSDGDSADQLRVVPGSLIAAVRRHSAGVRLQAGSSLPVSERHRRTAARKSTGGKQPHGAVRAPLQSVRCVPRGRLLQVPTDRADADLTTRRQCLQCGIFSR
eukprot:Tamp_26595.p1 GENE.Tamp_26595~~Tamp_26595.p1  ORF type:complete len:109 (+),score=1.79 Tamp_26595:55-381(+)